MPIYTDFKDGDFKYAGCDCYWSHVSFMAVIKNKDLYKTERKCDYVVVFQIFVFDTPYRQIKCTQGLSETNLPWNASMCRYTRRNYKLIITEISDASWWLSYLEQSVTLLLSHNSSERTNKNNWSLHEKPVPASSSSYLEITPRQTISLYQEICLLWLIKRSKKPVMKAKEWWRIGQQCVRVQFLEKIGWICCWT